MHWYAIIRIKQIDFDLIKQGEMEKKHIFGTFFEMYLIAWFIVFSNQIEFQF